MQTFPIVWSVSLFIALYLPFQKETPPKIVENPVGRQAQVLRQLAAVRGEITRITSPSKGVISITVKPAKEFQEVTVLARENDLVGAAVGKSSDSDLLGLLSDDTHDDETITAAELNEGDIVSVIYDPGRQNRVLEIYVR